MYSLMNIAIGPTSIPESRVGNCTDHKILIVANSFKRISKNPRGFSISGALCTVAILLRKMEVRCLYTYLENLKCAPYPKMSLARIKRRNQGRKNKVEEL